MRGLGGGVRDASRSQRTLKSCAFIAMQKTFGVGFGAQHRVGVGVRAWCRFTFDTTNEHDKVIKVGVLEHVGKTVFASREDVSRKHVTSNLRLRGCIVAGTTWRARGLVGWMRLMSGVYPVCVHLGIAWEASEVYYFRGARDRS